MRDGGMRREFQTHRQNDGDIGIILTESKIRTCQNCRIFAILLP